MRIIFSFILILTLSRWASGSAQPPDPQRLENEIRAFEIQDDNQPPPRDPILFVGSSTIRQWSNLAADFPGYPVMNRGFGGSTMNDVLFYFDRVVEVYRPALVVIYEGDNDLASGLSVEEVFEDFETFVALMTSRLPLSDFAIISVKPSPSRVGLLEGMADLNARMQTLAQENGGLYIDVFSLMLDSQGQPLPHFFLSDQLHLNTGGYRLWRNVITPVLDAWSEDHESQSHFTSITFVNGFVVLRWQGVGRLQRANDSIGPWMDIPVTGPGRFSQGPDQSRRFFRLLEE